MGDAKDIRRRAGLDYLLDTAFQSSTLCVCNYCGSTASFYGKPDEVNNAAVEFYRLHKEAHADEKGPAK